MDSTYRSPYAINAERARLLLLLHSRLVPCQFLTALCYATLLVAVKLQPNYKKFTKKHCKHSNSSLIRHQNCSELISLRYQEKTLELRSNFHSFQPQRISVSLQ